MKLLIKNVEYFEWELSEELIALVIMQLLYRT